MIYQEETHVGNDLKLGQLTVVGYIDLFKLLDMQLLWKTQNYMPLFTWCFQVNFDLFSWMIDKVVVNAHKAVAT